MNLNKIMVTIIEHHHKQAVLKLQYDMAFEMLIRTFVRVVPPIQREHELALSKQEILKGMENLESFKEDLESFKEEIFLELMGTAKSVIIDTSNQMEKNS